MGITKDCYLANYDGHRIEVVSNNWNKSINLLIDGEKVASESRVLPHDITLTKDFEHAGVQHKIVAKVVVHFPSLEVTLEVDGQEILITKTA